MALPTPLQLAQTAYKAYGESTGGMNFRGEPMPAWEGLGDTIRGAWVAAVGVVEHAILHTPSKEYSVQKPSLARMVLVTVDPAWNNGADVAPAVITRVWSDDKVNLRVFVDTGATPLSMTSVPLLDTEEQARAAGPSPAAWWPPRV